MLRLADGEFRTLRLPDPDLVVHAMTADSGGVRITLTDDGGGLPASADPARWEREGHMGLVGMRERVAASGGTLEAGPRATGPGWRVHARFPLRRGDR